jgi:hypothetical protein
MICGFLVYLSLLLFFRKKDFGMKLFHEEDIGVSTEQANCKIELVPLNQLAPYGNNPRTHSKKQIAQIARSMKRFGIINPVLIDEAGIILAGHGRVKAAELLGLTAVPALRLSHLSAAEKRAYVIADNRLAENASWDREILALSSRVLSISTSKSNSRDSRWARSRSFSMMPSKPNRKQMSRMKSQTRSPPFASPATGGCLVAMSLSAAIR